MRSRIRLGTAILLVALTWLLAAGGVDAGSAAPASHRDASAEILTAQDAATRVRGLYFDENHAAGVSEGEKLIERFPESSELRAWYLMNETRQFMVEDAIRGATALTVERPSDPWSWFALAGTLRFIQERYPESLKLSRKALAMAPNHPDFLWLRATILKVERPGEAMDFVEQVVPRVPNPANLLTVRGDAILALGYGDGDEVDPFFLDAALQEYQRARRADSRCVMAYTSAASALYFAHKPQESLPLMEQAVEIAPCSLGVHQKLWRTFGLLSEMTEKQKQARLEADIQTLLDCPGDDPTVLQAVAGQYGRIKLAAKQAQYQDRVLRDYPDSIAAELVLMDRIRALAEKEATEGRKGPQAAAALRPLLQDFINRPRHRAPNALGEAYMSLFFLMKDDPTATGDELLQAVNGMAEYMKWNYPMFYVQGPNALSDRGVHLDRAEELVLEGISRSEERRRVSRRLPGGVRAAQREWDRVHKAEQLDALGWVHLQQGRIEEAKRELVRASQLAPPTLDNLYHLGRLFETEGDLKRAQSFYAEGVKIQTLAENPSEKGLRGLYIKVNGSDAGYEEFRAQFEATGAEDAEERKARILAKRVKNPEPLGAFDLKTLEGNTVSSAELSGKILVVNFWGLWCGWCLKEMPDIQKLHEKYRSDPRVTILTVDNDPDHEKVRNWMKERNYDFPVLLDDDYVDKMGIKEFPTTWFVDERGRKAFVLVGWSKWLVEEYGWRIEALKDEGS